MDKEILMQDLVNQINGSEAKKTTNYEERLDLWHKEFCKKSALKWSDSIVSLETQYLKTTLANKKMLNGYDIKSLAPVDVRFLDKIIIWDNDVTSMAIDAIAIPASYDIATKGSKQLHDIYYCNGINLRKKLITIMGGEKLKDNEVLITRSYNVLADYIMHVNYVGLKESIINLMECARVNMIKAIAICISGTLEDVKLIYDTVMQYLFKYDMMFDKVIFAIEDRKVREIFIKELELNNR